VPVAQFIEIDIGADLHVSDQRDVQVEHALDLGVQDLPGKPVVRDRMTQHATGQIVLFVDGDGITATRHLVGKRQACRPGADYADGLRVSLCTRSFQGQ
jgi:hypothetical protein